MASTPLAYYFSALPKEAQRLGLDYFDMWIGQDAALKNATGVSGWGDEDNSDDGGVTGPALTYPFYPTDPELPSAAAIAIHPQSDVDRVMIQTFPGIQAPQSAGNSESPAPSIVAPKLTLVTPDAPFIVSPPSVGNTPGDQKTLKLIAHPDSRWQGNYVSASGSTVAFLSNDRRLSPLLALRFYLRPRLNGPIGRAPMQFPISRTLLGLGNGSPSEVNNGVFTFAAPTTPATEQTIIIWPTMGRSKARAYFRIRERFAGSPSANIRIATITGYSMIEKTVAQISALDNTATAEREFTPGDWTLIYGASLTGSPELTYGVRLED